MFKKFSLYTLLISNLICTPSIYASDDQTAMYPCAFYVSPGNGHPIMHCTPTFYPHGYYQLNCPHFYPRNGSPSQQQSDAQDNTSPGGIRVPQGLFAPGGPVPHGVQPDHSQEDKAKALYNRCSSTFWSIVGRSGLLSAFLTFCSNHKHSLLTLGASSLVCSAVYECLDKTKTSLMTEAFVFALLAGQAIRTKQVGKTILMPSALFAGSCLAKTLVDKITKVSRKEENSSAKSMLDHLVEFGQSMKENLSFYHKVVAKPLFFYTLCDLLEVPSSISHPVTAALVANNTLSSCAQICCDKISATAFFSRLAEKLI